MQDNIIAKLFASFSELEKAIQSARGNLEERTDIPEEVFERLESYDSIIGKQRRLAETLCVHLDKGDWDEVNRHVSLINGLSAMVRDDARAILMALAPKQTPLPDKESHYC